MSSAWCYSHFSSYMEGKLLNYSLPHNPPAQICIIRRSVSRFHRISTLFWLLHCLMFSTHDAHVQLALANEECFITGNPENSNSLPLMVSWIGLEWTIGWVSDVKWLLILRIEQRLGIICRYGVCRVLLWLTIEISTLAY